MNTNELIRRAWELKTVIPAFNIPYLPMMAPVTQALKDTNTVGLVTVARLEWEKFEAKSIKAVFEEFEKADKAFHTRLHLDHVPVIDEDNLKVNFKEIIKEAVQIGYKSVMVDGSRLSLAENIECTKQVVEIAHKAGIPVEAELGAVLGHESGPKLNYEELFKSGKGFTDPDEAVKFIKQTNVDWLSVAVGNIHGAISEGLKDKKKPEARINIEYLALINKTAGVPLVLHGGSGINVECIQQAVKNGIAKINVGTAIRQPYAKFRSESVLKAQDAVYETMLDVIKNELNICGSAKIICD
jgi:fructose-bisphosphate aldolase, class II